MLLHLALLSELRFPQNRLRDKVLGTGSCQGDDVRKHKGEGRENKMGKGAKPVKWVAIVGNWSSVPFEDLCMIQLRTGKVGAFIQWLLFLPHSLLG